MELSEFLLAQIAEDEEAARYWLNDEGGVAATGYPFGPARVLAECDAKRRIVLGCTHEVENWVVVRPGVRENRPVREPWSEDDTAQDVLTYLALPYADHPDYNPEWKP